ncbi:MAG: S-layer homology domain-containing protein [Lachnospiraceae bacterium]|nr:S-layer homology domain-containing protein [Lachnospiraceae bacterium]
MFSPNASVTNAQMLTFLSRVVGGKIHNNGLQQAALYWAFENGLLEGLPIMLDIEANCPRSDVVFFLWRNKIISGVDSSTISPQGTATRAQVAAVLTRYVQNIKAQK